MSPELEQFPDDRNAGRENKNPGPPPWAQKVKKINPHKLRYAYWRVMREVRRQQR